MIEEGTESKGVIITYQPKLAEMQVMAETVASSHMFGLDTKEQALALMLLCQAEGLHPIMALRRYHIIDGKPAMRADALQGEFEKEGKILWHLRTEKICCATFFRYSDKVNDAAIERARKRANYLLNAAQGHAVDVKELVALGWPDEVTIARTFDDCVAKGIAVSWKDGKEVLKKNWRQSPRQMLHWRCLTEGVRAVNPGLVAGVYTEDEIHDIGPAEEETDQRSASERAEYQVRAATANATEDAAVIPVSEEIKRRDAAQFPELPGNEFGPLTITADNYKELKSHVGKAQGNMLGYKVGDLARDIIEWMHDKWMAKLGPFASDQDMRLKKAIEFAYHAKPHVKEEDKPSGNPTGKESAIAWLRLQIEDMVMTEERFCQYVSAIALATKEDGSAEVLKRVESGGAPAKSLDELTESQLLKMSENFKVVKKAVEELVKPKPVKEAPPKKPRKRKGRAL